MYIYKSSTNEKVEKYRVKYLINSIKVQWKTLIKFYPAVNQILTDIQTPSILDYKDILLFNLISGQ